MSSSVPDFSNCPDCFRFFSCQKESQVPGLIVNSQFSDKNLSDNLVTRLRVKFITTSAFKPFDKDYKITAEALSKNNVFSGKCWKLSLLLQDGR
jgi:hypothetical protein